MTPARILYLPLEQIRESPTNPRKIFHGLEELAESIRAQGVLSPVRVRPLGDGDTDYELVFGARRLRAAKLAELTEIPASVVEMTDIEALEAQVVENGQREDVHPLEEADAYRELHEKHGKTVEEVADKVGKSKAYVYARMKLCALVEPGRKAFLEGKINASVALLLARIPNAKLQERATDEIVNPKYRPEPLSVRDAAHHIESKYMLRLAEAPFSRTDAALVPEAGACSTCPKRTGNQRELFSDVASADVCTDPPCYQKKASAAWRREKETAEEKGKRVLGGKKAAGIFERWDPKNVSSRAPYVDLSAKCPEDPKNRTYRQILGKDAGEIVVARDPRGRVHDLVTKEGLAEKLKAAGIKPLPPGQNGNPNAKWQQEDAKRRREHALRQRAQGFAMAELLEKIEKKGIDRNFWLLLCEVQLNVQVGDLRGILTRRGLVTTDERLEEQQEEIQAAICEMPAEKLAGLVFELAVESLGWRADKMRERLFARFKINEKGHLAAARELAKAEEKAAAKAAKQEAKASPAPAPKKGKKGAAAEGARA